GTIGPNVPKGVPARVGASVVAQRLDELLLALVRVSGQTELLRASAQFVDGPVLVAAGFTALAPDLGAALLRAARRVRDPGGLLLGGSVLPQLLVEFGILQS